MQHRAATCTSKSFHYNALSKKNTKIHENENKRTASTYTALPVPLLRQVFKRGSKRCSFLASIFASILWLIWGHFLDKFSKIFNVFRHWFSGYDFHVIMLGLLASLCAPRCPKMTFLLQKNSYFHGSACFSKVIGIITDFMDFYRFLVPVLAYLCLLLGFSFVH